MYICPTCGEEYTSEPGVGKTKLRYPDRVYQQHIRQPEYQKFKVKEHLRAGGKGTLKIFPLLQMQSSEIDLHRSYEKHFMKKYKTKLNDLKYESKACTRSALIFHVSDNAV